MRVSGLHSYVFFTNRLQQIDFNKHDKKIHSFIRNCSSDRIYCYKYVCFCYYHTISW